MNDKYNISYCILELKKLLVQVFEGKLLFKHTNTVALTLQMKHMSHPTWREKQPATVNVIKLQICA